MELYSAPKLTRKSTIYFFPDPKDQHRNKITFFLSERIFQIANDFSGKTENIFRIRDIR